MWIGGVRVILTNEKDEILMVKQHHENRDIWMVPGGGIEEGENSIEAAIREVKEETGLDVEIYGLAWHIEEVSEKRGQRFVNYMLGKIVGGDPCLGYDPEFDGEHQVLRDIKFMSKEELEKVENLHPDFLNKEIWSILLDEEANGMTHYKLR